MKKLHCILFAMLALISAMAWGQVNSTTTPIPSSESVSKQAVATPMLSLKYEGTWKRQGPGGRDLEAGMNFQVLSQGDAKASGKFTSQAYGAYVRADQCYAFFDEPFEAQYVEEKKAWQFVVSTARCGKWRYLFFVQADGSLTGEYRGKDFDAVTYFDLKPTGALPKTNN